MTNGKLKTKGKADKCASAGKVSMVTTKKNLSIIHPYPHPPRYRLRNQ